MSSGSEGEISDRKDALDEDDSEFEGGSEQDHYDLNDGFMAPDEEVEEFEAPRRKKKHSKRRKHKKLELDEDDRLLIDETEIAQARPKIKRPKVRQ